MLPIPPPSSRSHYLPVSALLLAPSYTKCLVIPTTKPQTRLRCIRSEIVTPYNVLSNYRLRTAHVFNPPRRYSACLRITLQVLYSGCIIIFALMSHVHSISCTPSPVHHSSNQVRFDLPCSHYCAALIFGRVSKRDSPCYPSPNDPIVPQLKSGHVLSLALRAFCFVLLPLHHALLSVSRPYGLTISKFPATHILT